jgi:hypothetical protein
MLHEGNGRLIEVELDLVTSSCSAVVPLFTGLLAVYGTPFCERHTMHMKKGLFSMCHCELLP